MTGEILALLSALSFAGFNVLAAATAESRGDKGVLFSVLVTIVFSGALFALFESGRVNIGTAPNAWAGFGFFALAGISAMVFGRTLVFSSIRRLGATRAAAVKRLNPFFSVLLAAIFLSETITGFDAAGLIAIAVAFGILIRESLGRNKVGLGAATPTAYLVGAGAALAYSIAYIGRKAGLELLNAPALGTFVSALSGFLGFVLLAAVSRRYRANFLGIFRNVDRRVLGAGILVSAGQIFMFAALAHEKVSTVVIIASLEVFITIFLTTLVFRSESRPGIPVLLSAALAVLGACLVAGG